MPIWAKPTYIALAVLGLLLAVQTWRLHGAQLDVAYAATEKAMLISDISAARDIGLMEGVRQQREAQEVLNEKHRQIVTGLEADKRVLQKHYDVTYGMLKDLAATDRFSCLKDPLPENALEEFRR